MYIERTFADASIAEKENTPRHDKHGIRARLLALLTLGDLIAIVLGTELAAGLYLDRLDHPHVATFLPLVLTLYYILSLREGAFRISTVISPTRSTRRAATSLALAVILVISITFMAKATDDLSRGLALFGGISSMVFLIIARTLFADYAFRRLDGRAESEVVLIDGLAPPKDCTAFKVDVSTLGITPDINNPAVLAQIGELVDRSDRVIISCLPERRAAWSLALKGAGVNVEVLAPELDAIGAISGRHYHGTTTALVASRPLNAVDRLIKRCFDLALAIPAMIVLAPLFATIAILIKLDSPGPVFFVQKRVGKSNRMFAMYKFRSMYTDRSDHSASQLTTRDDARVTRIGSFIRKTSIDELPQLLNVINGDMSIVGPRPHATGALAGSSLYWEVSSNYWDRHAVKPGLTGLAQVRGFRGNTETGDDLMKRLQADLEYLDSWSIWRDIAVVIQTFNVLVHRNAF